MAETSNESLIDCEISAPKQDIHIDHEETDKSKMTACALCGIIISGINHKTNFDRHLYKNHFRQTFENEHGDKIPKSPPFNCQYEACTFIANDPKRKDLLI